MCSLTCNWQPVHQAFSDVGSDGSRTRAQVRGLACQRPRTVVFVAGAPTHGQRERDGEPWVKMDAGFSVRHLVAPMRAIARQCDTPAHNLVRARTGAAAHPSLGPPHFL